MKEINIGMLVNTHGLRGEMKVKVLTDFPQLRFQKGAVVHLQLAQGQFDLKVQHVRESKGQLLVKFKGYDDIKVTYLWSYLAAEVFSKTNDLTLADIVSHIMHVDVVRLNAYIENNLKRTGIYQNKE